MGSSMSFSSGLSRGRLVAILPFCAALLLAACSKPVGAAADADPSDVSNPNQLRSCSSTADCPDLVAWECVGVCLQKCADDDECPATSYCNAQAHCLAGCRTSAQCASGDHCIDGGCVAGAGSGTCTTKCDCATGEVCVEGACQAPPGQCAGPADCPRGPRGPPDQCDSYVCDGFAKTCIDPAPSPCSTAADCAGRPGCAGGCACNEATQCIPQVSCTTATEDADCGTGRFCDATGACEPAPTCTTQQDCLPIGFTCNAAYHQCERPHTCSSTGDCSDETPYTYCDRTHTPALCAVASCTNGGVTCSGSQTCAADGRCTTSGTGGGPVGSGLCQGNADCPSDQFCAFLFGVGVCTPGCQSNVSCGSGQVCNGDNACVAPSSTPLGAVNDTCVTGADCQGGLFCFDLAFGLLPLTCQEGCNQRSTACAGNPNCCPLTHKPQCNAFGVCAD